MPRRKNKKQPPSLAKPLSAHEAGKVVSHSKKPATRYSDEEPQRALTVKEGEVLSKVAEGTSNEDIAGEQRSAVGTVEKHLERIYSKLRVRSRADAAIWLLKRRLAEKDRIIAQQDRRIARLERQLAQAPK